MENIAGGDQQTWPKGTATELYISKLVLSVWLSIPLYQGRAGIRLKVISASSRLWSNNYGIATCHWSVL